MLDLSADNQDGFEDTDGQLYTSNSFSNRRITGNSNMKSTTSYGPSTTYFYFASYTWGIMNRRLTGNSNQKYEQQDEVVDMKGTTSYGPSTTYFYFASYTNTIMRGRYR